MDISREEIKNMFDVALLRPTTTAADVECFARAAQEQRFCQICVNTVHIARAAAALKGTSVKVVAPIGFPMGITKTEVMKRSALLTEPENTGTTHGTNSVG